MQAADRSHIEVLCTAAGEAARRRGHQLDEWVVDPAGGASARCKRCGRFVYVRSGPGLGGVTGDALAEGCSESPASQKPPATTGG